MNRQDLNDGYSLLEMIVSLMIFSLIAIVAYNGLTSSRSVRTAADLGRKIAQLSNNVSARAVLSGQTAILAVDFNKRLITDNLTKEVLVIPDGMKVHVLTGRELIENDRIANIEYFNDGSSSGGEISIEDAKHGKQTISINWLTGAVSITGGSK